jgi:hypothetical protein
MRQGAEPSATEAVTVSTNASPSETNVLATWVRTIGEKVRSIGADCAEASERISDGVPPLTVRCWSPVEYRVTVGDAPLGATKLACAETEYAPALASGTPRIGTTCP